MVNDFIRYTDRFIRLSTSFRFLSLYRKSKRIIRFRCNDVQTVNDDRRSKEELKRKVLVYMCIGQNKNWITD